MNIKTLNRKRKNYYQIRVIEDSDENIVAEKKKIVTQVISRNSPYIAFAKVHQFFIYSVFKELIQSILIVEFNSSKKINSS